MATTHLKNLVVVTGEYQDRQGNTKKRYKTIGRKLRNDNGEFLVMDRTFNPAGLPGEGDIFISLFDPQERNNGGGQQQSQGGGYGSGGSPMGGDMDDVIPFAMNVGP